jgi:enoyl-CoA hydratase/carnithine racemase
MNARVRIRCEGPLGFLCLTRAEQHNGMDFAMLRAVVAAQQKLANERALRALIVHGEGPSFCAGLDVKSVLAEPLRAALMATQLYTRSANLFQRWSMGLRRLPLPVIAVIHGNCFGAGLQLALGADIRIATPDAQLSIMEAKWGLVPDMGGIALLRELLPIDVAKELTFTGRILSGREAHALGLVSHVSEDPMAHARRLAEEIETRSPDAVAAAKQLLQEAWLADEAGALRAERKWQRRVLGRENQRVAIRRNRAGDQSAYTTRKIGT